MLRSIDPATGTELAKFPEADEAAVEAAIARAWDVRRGWRDAGIEHRSQLIRAVAGVLRADEARYASILTAEMGKPIVEAEGEVEKCAWTAEWIADNAARLLADEPVDSTGSKSYVRFQPLGVVLAVMPWNFPFWQAFRAGLPALAAGNVMLLKHASNVPQAAVAIEEVFREAGLPDGVFQTLLVGSGMVDRIISDRRVAGVTLTGSEAAGAKVAETAGKGLKKTALERQVRESVGMGARVLVGGKRVDGKGNYFEPTVIGGVTRDMPVFKEETFGPVAALIRVNNEEEALAAANDSDFGLGSCVWTADVSRGERFAERVEAGLVFINGMVASDARLPFGGVKRSGYGRELGSYGIREFTNIRTVWVGPAKT